MLTLPTRVCRRCQVEKGLDAFPVRSPKEAHLRRWTCRACLSASAKARAATLRQRQLDDACYDFNRRVRDADDWRVESLCRRAIERFGGVNAFMELWGRHVGRLMEERPTAARTCAALACTLRLLEYVDSQRTPPEDLDRLSTAELEAQQRAVVAELAGQTIVHHPAEVAEILRAMGWQCIPPSASL